MKILKTVKPRVLAGEIEVMPAVTEVRPLPVRPDAMRDSNFPERAAPKVVERDTYSRRRRP